MTVIYAEPAPSPAVRAGAPVRVALRAFVLGALAIAALTPLLVFVVLPESLLAGDDRRFALLGAGVAVLAGGLATLSHTRLAARSAATRFGADPRLQRMEVQTALALGFGAKILGLLIGFGALFAANVKFTGLAAFAVAFVAGSLVLQLWTAARIALALARASAADSARPTDPTT
jgi:hypothetical protein